MHAALRGNRRIQACWVCGNGDDDCAAVARLFVLRKGKRKGKEDDWCDWKSSQASAHYQVKI